MITILGAILGFFTSFMPDFLRLFTAAADRKHELAMLDLQLRMADKQHDYKMAEIGLQADAATTQAVYKAAERPTGVKWIEGLIGTVRPVITYAFFLLYAAVKVSQIYLALRTTGDVWLALPAVWHEEDAALFATIMAFWFGQRLSYKRFAAR